MISVDDILTAGRRLAPHLSPTPLIHSPWLSMRASAEVRLKLESLAGDPVVQGARSSERTDQTGLDGSTTCRRHGLGRQSRPCGRVGRRASWPARGGVHARIGSAGQARAHPQPRRRTAIDCRRLRGRRTQGDGVLADDRRGLCLGLQPRGRHCRRRHGRAGDSRQLAGGGHDRRPHRRRRPRERRRTRCQGRESRHPRGRCRGGAVVRLHRGPRRRAGSCPSQWVRRLPTASAAMSTRTR